MDWKNVNWKKMTEKMLAKKLNEILNAPKNHFTRESMAAEIGVPITALNAWVIGRVRNPQRKFRPKLEAFFAKFESNKK